MPLTRLPAAATRALPLALLGLLLVAPPARAEDEDATRIDDDTCWVEQAARSDDILVEACVNEDDGRDARFVSAVRILDAGSRRLLQEVDVEPVDDLPNRPADFVALPDINRDGISDLQVSAVSGGAGPNSMDTFFVSDRKRRRWNFEPSLSDLSQVSIDTDGTIRSGSRDGCCSHSAETWAYIDGALVPLTMWNRWLSPDGKHVVTTTAELHGSRWRWEEVIQTSEEAEVWGPSKRKTLGPPPVPRVWWSKAAPAR